MSSENPDVATLKLLAEIFDAPRFRTPNFLHWLYRENPVADAVTIILPEGHLAAIPQNFYFDGKPARFGLALHSAVSERARGQGLFGRMAQDLVEKGRAFDLTHIIGVANGNATRGWISRGGFTLVRPLPVRAGFFPGPFRDKTVREVDSSALDAGYISEPYGNGQCWPPEVLRWRLAMPGNAYRLFSNGRATAVVLLERKAGLQIALLLKVWAAEKLGRAETRRFLAGVGAMAGTPFLIYAGMNARFRFPGLPLPRKLLPSPLNLIVRTLDPTYGKDQDFDLQTFEFLDFDAY